MSVLNLNLQARQDVPKLERGEYELRIVSVDTILAEDKTKDDPDFKARRINVRCESVENAMADDVYHSLWLPRASDTEKSKNKKMNVIANFIEAIDLDSDVSEIDTTEWIGCTFIGQVEVDTQGNTSIKQISRA